MFRCYGLFRHVVGTMTLEDPNRFKTSRSFVLGAHVVKLQCKQSASVLSQSQTLMTNVFFLSMTTPPPAKMKKKLTSDKLKFTATFTSYKCIHKIRTHMYTNIKQLTDVVDLLGHVSDSVRRALGSAISDSGNQTHPSLSSASVVIIKRARHVQAAFNWKDRLLYQILTLYYPTIY